MISIHLPPNIEFLLQKYVFNVVDDNTLYNIKTTLDEYCGHEIMCKISTAYDYYGYLTIMLCFDTEEDAIAFKLRHGS